MGGGLRYNGGMVLGVPGRCLVGGRGNAANGVVVLLHGVGMNAGFWRQVGGHLSRRFCVITPDLYGNKSNKGGGLSIDDYTADVASILRAFNKESASGAKAGGVLVVGHSLGAHTALALARAKPNMAAGIVALGAVYCRNAAAQKAVRSRAKLLASGGKAKVIDKTLQRWREDDNPAAEQQARRMLEQTNEKDYAAAYGVFAECGGREALPHNINLPMLFAAGGNDINATPGMAKKMAAAVKSGCFYVVDGRRHLFPITAGREVAGLIKDFYAAIRRGEKFNGGAFVAAADNNNNNKNNNKTRAVNNIGNKTKSRAKKDDDKMALRRAFGSFITGVTVVAAFDKARNPRGFTANSFASVSMHPPLLSVCLAKAAGSYDTFRTADAFSVSILGGKQRAIAARFAARNDNKFDGVSWTEQNNAPRIGGAAAWFGCTAKRRIICGDHCILIGEVKAFAATARAPLGYLRGAYIQPALEWRALAAAAKGGNITGAIVEKEEKVYLQKGKKGMTLPFASGGKLKESLRSCGLECDFGFLYSVYAKSGGGRVVVYRAEWKGGAPLRGGFFALDDLPPIDDPAVRVLLRRFAAERKSGEHALYVGGEKTGAVHHLRP